MRRQFIILIGLLLAVSGRAGDLLMKEVFRTMPDSLMPYLSENNRLDFIDFMDSGMKAEVRNTLGGTSEMTALTVDSLSIRMSEALRVDMLLLAPSQEDTCRVVCFVQTYGTDSLSLESTVDYYTTTWQQLAVAPELSASDKRRIAALKVQTILKRDEEMYKKN